MCQQNPIITIPADVMQNHIEDNHTMRLKRFELNTHDLSIDWTNRRGQDEPDIEYDFEVEADLEYSVELDEYVHVDIYDDHTVQLARTIMAQSRQIDLLLETIVDLRFQLADKKPFWKFW